MWHLFHGKTAARMAMAMAMGKSSISGHFVGENPWEHGVFFGKIHANSWDYLGSANLIYRSMETGKSMEIWDILRGNTNAHEYKLKRCHSNFGMVPVATWTGCRWMQNLKWLGNLAAVQLYTWHGYMHGSYLVDPLWGDLVAMLTHQILNGKWHVYACIIMYQYLPALPSGILPELRENYIF